MHSWIARYPIPQLLRILELPMASPRARRARMFRLSKVQVRPDPHSVQREVPRNGVVVARMQHTRMKSSRSLAVYVRRWRPFKTRRLTLRVGRIQKPPLQPRVAFASALQGSGEDDLSWFTAPLVNRRQNLVRHRCPPGKFSNDLRALCSHSNQLARGCEQEAGDDPLDSNT